MVWLAVAALMPALCGPLSATAAVDATGIEVFSPVLQELQEAPPIERRARKAVRNLYRNIRRSVKRSTYLIQSSPRWWGRRLKRMLWPVVFAITALFFDSALLDAWRRDGLRVLRTYVPMMLYVYGKLFFSSGASVLARLGVVAALVYGLWRGDLIRDGRWTTLSMGRLDDLVVIALAIRLFVQSCPDELVGHYAERAVEIRRRIFPARHGPGAGGADAVS